MSAPKSLRDPKCYRYAGKCRHCGAKNEWVVDRSSMEWVRFYSLTKENHFPQFINYCEDCDNEAVFDLTAISARPNP